MRLNTIVLTAAISIASIIPAFAHHGWAEMSMESPP